MDWKGIAEKTIVAVLAGAILAAGALAYSRMFPSGQSISAVATWVDVENPLFIADRKFVFETGKLIQQYFGVDAAVYLNHLSAGSEARLGRITFSNNSETRSKEVFVSIEGAAIYSPDATDQAGTTRSKLSLKPILPGKSASVFYVEKQYYRFFGTDVTAIHDERAVAVDVFQWPSDFEWIGTIIFRYPVPIAGIFMMGLMIIVLGIIGGIATLFIRDMVAWRAKHNTAETIAKDIAYIDYVRAHYPEKMPKPHERPPPAAS